MIRISLLLAFLLLNAYGIAQDLLKDKLTGARSGTFSGEYRTVSPERISYFTEPPYGNISCVRIDSVKSEPDTVYYPFSVIQQMDYGCYTARSGSWIGKKIILKEDGLELFINRNDDTIRIFTKAENGTYWTAFLRKDSSYVIASVTGMDTMSFLGLCDTVKTIEFQSYSKENKPESHQVNNLWIKLSKNYGFVQTLNFFDFPDWITGLEFPLEEYTVAGLSEPETGIKNLSWFDIWDFKPGDEIHVIEAVVFGYELQFLDSAINKKIYRFLSRTESEDSIKYIYELKSLEKNISPKGTTAEFTIDTLAMVIFRDSLFDITLPGEPVIFSEEAWSYTMNSNGFLSKTIPSLSMHFRGDDGSECLSNCCWDGCFPEYAYFKGLGGPYWYCSNVFSYGDSRCELVYYLKDRQTWGTPLLLTGVESTEGTIPVKVFPNPARDKLRIESEEDLFLEIFSIEGKLISSQDLNCGPSELDVTGFNKGIYCLTFTNKDGKMTYDKIIIE